MEDRIEYIDFLRGIAIISVVMGHIIQYNIQGEAADKCFDFIYSFHMGFFFFISGCAASLREDRNTWSNVISFVKKKTIQLLMPFFVWGGVVVVVLNENSMSVIPIRFVEILKYPDHGAPWFLLHLFFIQLVFFLCCALTKRGNINKIRTVVLLLSVPLILSFLYFKSFFIEGYTWIDPVWLLLFILGSIIKKIEINDRMARLIVVFFFTVFLIFVPHYDYQMKDFVERNLIKMITSVTFSIFAYELIKVSYDKIGNIEKKVINYLGTNTLEIYVTHFLLIRIVAHPWVETGTMNAIPLFLILFLVS